jgi:Golgi SNAP receptor complex protein 2
VSKAFDFFDTLEVTKQNHFFYKAFANFCTSGDLLLFSEARSSLVQSSMTSIGELFPKCRKLAYDARQQLALLHSSNGTATELYLTIEELNRQLDVMDDLLLRETTAQRPIWKHKIQELRQEAAQLQQQGQQQFQTSHYQRQRDELLRRRRKNPQDNDLTNLAEESQSLESSNYAVLGLISQADASYQELVEQRQRLRGVSKIVVDIGNALGITQSTMRIIERRDITDAYLVAAGMVITLLVIYFVWF